MRWLLVLALSSITGFVGAQVQNPGNGHWYIGDTPGMPFLSAQALAATCGGTLVALEDAAEEQWVVGQFTVPFMTALWIGLSDQVTEGVFLWDSGEPLVYTNWLPGEPNNSPSGADAVALSRLAGGFWKDEHVSSSYPAVIELLAAPTPPVTAVGAVPGVLTIELTWQNPIVYDEIEIHRFGALIAVLPGSATSFLDTAPSTASRAYWIIGKVTGSPATPAFRSAQAITPAHEFAIPPVSTIAGSPVMARVLLRNDDDIGGWSYGVCHDDALADVIEVEMGETTATSYDGNPPTFHLVEILPGGFTVAVLIGWGPAPWDLPPGMGHELDRVIYLPLVAAPAQIPLEFCDTLGSPQVFTVVVDAGQSLVPLTVDGAIEVTAQSFIRSDCNGDIAPDVADVVYIGMYLFGDDTAPTPPCLDACDANGDAVLDVSDMVYAALALFGGGTPPGPPYPACGAPPAPNLECGTPSTCP